MQWFSKVFTDLEVTELYQILKLRSDIFVVEQNCVYSDMDGLDTLENTIHLFSKVENQVVSYLRILGPDVSHPQMPCFGRVVTDVDLRSKGIGHILITRAIDLMTKEWPNSTCHISAQSHLREFYEQHGFEVATEEYLEDDIPHIGMEAKLSIASSNQI